MMKRLCYAVLVVLMLTLAGLVARWASAMLWRTVTDEEPPTPNV